jgi:hypothetical protein
MGSKGKAGSSTTNRPRGVGDTTNTARSTRTTIAQPGTGSQDRTPSVQKQKADRLKRSMKARVKAPPTSVRLTPAQAQSAARKAAVKGAASTVGRAVGAASRALGPIGAIAGAASMIGDLPKSGMKSKGGQMARGKKK